jgi:hypothetical protein
MIWPRRVYVETFTAAGFAFLSQGTVHQEASPDLETYVGKIGSRVYSDLAGIPDEAFDRGFARLKEACLSLPDRPVMEDVDYFVFQC